MSGLSSIHQLPATLSPLLFTPNLIAAIFCTIRFLILN